MPKEIIAGSAVDGAAPFHVKVGWTKDREVQVGVEANEGRSLFWQLTGTGTDVGVHDRSRRLSELGGLLRHNMAEGLPLMASGDDPAQVALDSRFTRQAHLADEALATVVLNTLDSVGAPAIDGVWATLDRAGCNALIRNVRRARNAAYGGDE